MLLTEDEARKKWCPFGPTHHVPSAGEATGAPEVDVIKSRSRCIARACMAWRWHYQGSRQLASHSTEAHPAHVDAVKTERGYCGLAGRPS